VCVCVCMRERERGGAKLCEQKLKSLCVFSLSSQSMYLTRLKEIRDTLEISPFFKTHEVTCVHRCNWCVLSYWAQFRMWECPRLQNSLWIKSQLTKWLNALVSNTRPAGRFWPATSFYVAPWRFERKYDHPFLKKCKKNIMGFYFEGFKLNGFTL